MKLYRTKVPTIAREVLDLLTRENDIEVAPDHRDEAIKDLVAIMEDYLRRDNDFRNLVRDDMARRNVPYDQYGQVRKQIAEQTGHALGDDVERFLCRQFIEMMLNSPHVDEVYEEDKEIYRKVMGILRANDVDETAIRAEAATKIKNVKEGTVEYEEAMLHAMRDVKKRKGLLEER